MNKARISQYSPQTSWKEDGVDDDELKERWPDDDQDKDQYPTWKDDEAIDGVGQIVKRNVEVQKKSWLIHRCR